ncbi:MAG: metalloregulator ArsR/SmtB family transcription factor [Proteobacteria bacterium]|nr:MAG: metalloregulator ArsR/SmtB family transcription factor [Pseudomonadota bacterium]
MHRVSVGLHEIFQALSDPTRIRIVQLLLNSSTPLCLCDFAEALSEPEYKLSRHIKLLRSAGLLSAEREGKWIYHSLVKEEKYIKSVMKSIELFPVSAPSSGDLLRLNKRISRRSGGKCKEVDELKPEKIRNKESRA